MSFSNLVSDLAFRDAYDDRSSQISHARSQATARSYTSTAATSVSISGDISSQLHAGYSHPLTRSWQAERQLTKVRGVRVVGQLIHALKTTI
jgi:porphobilinogen synthase